MFILNVTKVSNNEVNVCRSNPCEQKALASEWSEHSVSNSFFYFQPELTLAHGGFLYMVHADCASSLLH